MMNVLVTGGAGYIGSHVVEELQKNGFTPIVYDNLSTGHAAAVPEEVQLVEGDIHDVAFLKHIMAQFEIDQRHMFWHSSICWLEERAACIIWAVKMVSACARSSMLLKRLRG